MKRITFFAALLMAAGCQTPKEQEPDLDEMVLSEDEEILEGTLAGGLPETPQETPASEPFQSDFKVE